ncbi:uncharacterized protein [Ptychodera flava]|uniref:uncharacterized protein n=1 Tax=Ptychodera flava TaxID=63121 RepID=UPI003969F7DA
MKKSSYSVVLIILGTIDLVVSGDGLTGVPACTDCQAACQSVSPSECPYMVSVPKKGSQCAQEFPLSPQSELNKIQERFEIYKSKAETQTEYILNRYNRYQEREAKLFEYEKQLQEARRSCQKTVVKLKRRKDRLKWSKNQLMKEVERLRAQVEELTRKGCDKDEKEYDYGEVLHKSLLFYEAQRSGKLPDDNRIPWRNDSAMDDRGINGEDLTGGYYDAGDHLKFGLPASYTATVLAWGLVEFPDAYEVTGELKYMLDCLRWFADYFIKCHTGENEFYVHIGNVQADHGYWGPAETMTMDRPAYPVNASHPGSDVVAGTAAAMAAMSIAFRDHDKSYSDLLLAESRSLWRFAEEYRGKYSDSVPEASVYDSNGYMDELIFAALWLHYATDEQHYLDFAIDNYYQLNQGRPYSYGWNDALGGLRLLLYKFVKHDLSYRKTTAYIDNWLPGARLPYTPLGLVFRSEWGSLRYAATTSFIALVAAEYGIKPNIYRPWAKGQIGYILGDTGRSFLVGYGVNPPVKPHHRGSSCPTPPARCGYSERGYKSPDPNPHVLYGAVIGGPDINDYFADDRTDYVHNEVAIDYNAGFQSAVAGLKHLQLIGEYPED